MSRYEISPPYFLSIVSLFPYIAAIYLFLRFEIASPHNFCIYLPAIALSCNHHLIMNITFISFRSAEV